MIKSLITLMYHFTNELPLNSSYIFIDIMLLLIIILLLKYKNKSRDYKIYNFTMNTIIIFIYIIVFILLLLYFRYIRWGFTFDLNLIYTKASLLVANKPLYHLTTILLILLIRFLLLLHSKHYMIRCFLKQYLYYYYGKKNQTHLKFMKNNPGKHIDQLVITYPLFIKVITNLGNTWSYDYRIKIFLLYNIEVPYCILAETKI